MSKSVIFPSSCIISLMLFLALNIVLAPTAFAKAEIIKTFTKKECTSAEHILSADFDRDGKLWLLCLKEKKFGTTSWTTYRDTGYCILAGYNGSSWKEEFLADTIVNTMVTNKFQRAGDGRLYILSATQFLDGLGQRFVGGPIFKQTSSGWKKYNGMYSFSPSYCGVVFSDSTLIKTNAFSDTILVYKNGQLVKKSKIDTSTAPVSSSPKLYADDAGGAWVLWDASSSGLGLHYWNGDSCSLFMQENRHTLNGGNPERVFYLSGGGIAIAISGHSGSLDTLVFVKNKVIDKQKYVVLRYDYNFFPDSLERLWTFDSTKAWVNTGTRSDTLLASSLSLGKIRSLVVSHNASVSAVRCDSGVAIFKVFHDPTPIRPLISSPANLAGKTNLKVQRFSLNGRAITDSKMFHNQIVIERGVDSKINKRLFMRN